MKHFILILVTALYVLTSCAVEPPTAVRQSNLLFPGDVLCGETPGNCPAPVPGGGNPDNWLQDGYHNNQERCAPECGVYPPLPGENGTVYNTVGCDAVETLTDDYGVVYIGWCMYHPAP